jgi:hypothetical protein
LADGEEFWEEDFVIDKKIGFSKIWKNRNKGNTQ